MADIKYSIENIKARNWAKSVPDFTKVAIDMILGFIVIYLFSGNNPIVYIGVITALIPDSLTLISRSFPNKFLAKHDDFHIEKVHYLKHKKISNFWRILTQIIAVAVSFFLLRI